MFGCRVSAVLTQTQGRVLDFIAKFVGDAGYPPTAREIAAAFGWASNGTNARLHLESLERKGHIARERGVSRGIRLLTRQCRLELLVRCAECDAARVPSVAVCPLCRCARVAK